MRKSYKNCIVSLIRIIILFSYVSCAFGVKDMNEDYVVTINGITMYKNAAMVLFKRIVEDEKESVSIVDGDTGKNLAITAEMLEPELNILINDSKNMVKISELFEIVKMYARESKEDLNSKIIQYDDNITLMELGSKFCISANNRIILYVNKMFQITKMYIFKYDTSSEIEALTPIHE